MDEHSSDNTPMAWLVIGTLVSIIAGAVYGFIGDELVGYVALFVSGIGGICAFAGATGYGVLLALRQHRRETGGL